jgi:two-component system LytT family response regulator
MIRAIIIDDEPIQHDILKRNLTSFCPEVKVTASFYSGAEAIAKLPSQDFDILLLDIELGDMNSFEMLQQTPLRDTHIIFFTSFDNYAFQAFRVHAVDYLLKPVDGGELRNAIDRAMAQIISRERSLRLIADYSLGKNNKILVPDGNDYKLINIDKILYCKSDGNYTDIIHIDQGESERRSTNTHSLRYFEEKLKPYGFIRVHQSYLVNKEYVSRIRKSPNEILLVNGTALPVARDRKHDVIEFFQG